MSRVLMIIGTDWSGPRPEWVRQPFLDNGRFDFNRMHRPDWDNVFYELGDVARVDSLAVGIRGMYDTGSVDSLSIARAAYQATHTKPTLMPWFDTVGLPDIAGPPDAAHAFDFANPEHIRFGWERYAKVFFDRFGDLPLERSPRGKVLCAWWGIETNTGHGFRNQQHAQRLLDSINTRLLDLGLVGADHIVDQSWAKLVPNLNVFAVHDWFNPWGISPKASSIRTHNGVTVGMTVPSFYRIINPDGNADTITAELAKMRAAKADYVLLEGGTDFTEGAEFMRDASGNTSKLDAVRKHIELTQPTPVPLPEPIEPIPEPLPGGLMQLAVTTEPILKWKTGVLVPSGIAANRYGMRWTQPNKTTPGYPDPASQKFFCLNPDGTTEAKDAIGEWEASQPVEPDDVEIRWFTSNAGGNQSSTLVYGLQQFAA